MSAIELAEPASIFLERFERIFAINDFKADFQVKKNTIPLQMYEVKIRGE